MTPAELKASILQYAMSGKLTEQLKCDGTASDLVPLLHIDPKIVPNEQPFDIPENWMWIPIGNLGETIDTDSFSDGPFGSNLKTVHYIQEPEVRIIQLSNIGEDGWKDRNVKFTSYKHLEEVIPRCEVHPGDFVIAKMMPAGRTIEVPDLGTRITLGSDAMKFVPNKVLDKQYLLWAMHSQAFLGQVYAEAHGITRVRTTLNGVKSYVLPIPPLEEQHRIVSRIEELLPYVDDYAKAYEKLESFNAKFPEEMKKSILQYAIQGKLVEQKPEEGTAEELCQQILKEKQNLISEGSIPKEKKLAEISDEEKEFELPIGWKYVRVQDVATYITDYVANGSFATLKKHTNSYKTKNYALFVRTMDLTANFSGELSYIDKESYDFLEKSKLFGGELILPNIGGSIGKAFIMPDLGMPMSLAPNSIMLKFVDPILNKYFGYLIQSPYGSKLLLDTKGGTATPKFSKTELRNMVFMLPPLKEVYRIVDAIEHLLPLCNLLNR